MSGLGEQRPNVPVPADGPLRGPPLNRDVRLLESATDKL